MAGPFQELGLEACALFRWIPHVSGFVHAFTGENKQIDFNAFQQRHQRWIDVAAVFPLQYSARTDQRDFFAFRHFMAYRQAVGKHRQFNIRKLTREVKAG
ncbi:hypothetical protein D3C80_1610760 [compost metagenome]